MAASQLVVLILVVSAVLRAQSSVAAVPDPSVVVRELGAQQRKMDLIKENYTFRETVETDELDSAGSVKSSVREEREVFFVNRHRIARLVKKDGRELAPGDANREQHRVTGLVNAAVKGPPGRTLYGEEGEVGLSGILGVMKVSNPRRMVLSGRNALVYDFVGDPHAKASGVAENAGRRVAGTIWIDDADRAVVRLEATFDDTFKVGGGILVTVRKGTSVRIDQARVGEGLWMRTSSDVHLTLREFLVNSVRRDIHTRDVEFQKFDIGMVEHH